MAHSALWEQPEKSMEDAVEVPVDLAAPALINQKGKMLASLRAIRGHLGLNAVLRG
jgi:hypothetical protein